MLRLSLSKTWIVFAIINTSNANSKQSCEPYATNSHKSEAVVQEEHTNHSQDKAKSNNDGQPTRTPMSDPFLTSNPHPLSPSLTLFHSHSLLQHRLICDNGLLRVGRRSWKKRLLFFAHKQQNPQARPLALDHLLYYSLWPRGMGSVGNKKSLRTWASFSTMRENLRQRSKGVVIYSIRGRIK